MLIVAALGGNALLERGEVPIAETEEKHILAAVDALAPLGQEHDLVITHGNGPQVGLLALESASDPALPHPYPFDVLGAQTQGMIGYYLLQAFENAMPGQQVVSLISQTLVDADDPAFQRPTKFVGPVYSADVARGLARSRGWQIRQDGHDWRRVVPSPEPRSLVELATVKMLLADGALVICAGGGGVPVVRGENGDLHGVEAVLDKDLTASLLACELRADVLLLLTDVAGVETGYGTEEAMAIRQMDPAGLRALGFPAGSMGPKVEAACRFVDATGHRAVIGRLEDAGELLAGTRGTTVRALVGRTEQGQHIGPRMGSPSGAGER
jgi:carbamate kinase